MARFIPDRRSDGSSQKYYITSTRYFYDCGDRGAACSDFLTAFVMPTRPPLSGTLIGGSSTLKGEISIVEVDNVSSESVSTEIRVYDANGIQQERFSLPVFELRGRTSNRNLEFS